MKRRIRPSYKSIRRIKKSIKSASKQRNWKWKISIILRKSTMLKLKMLLCGTWEDPKRKLIKILAKA